MNKIAVITGANSGIGQPLSELLAKDGFDLLFLNRSRERSQALLAAVARANPNVSTAVIETDLMDHVSVRAACGEVSKRVSAVSVLVNNAGVLTRQRTLSPQGQDGHFQVNCLTPTLIMTTLRPQLAAAKGARILNVGSSAMSQPFVGPLRVDDLSLPTRMDILGAYAQSKLALAVMGAAMAPEFVTDSILIRTACPGANRTTMTKRGDGMPWLLQALVPLFFADPSKGAKRLYGALFDERFGGQTGVYIEKGRIKPLPNHADNPALRAQLMAKLDDLMRT